MKFPSKTKKSALPTDKVSRTAPAKDTAPGAATSGQSASTPDAGRAPEGPASSNAAQAASPGDSPVESKASGVILKQEQPATVTAARQGGASWFIPAQKPSGFGGK